MTPNHLDPSQFDKETHQRVSFSEYATQLLNDPEIAALEPAQQGGVIIDRFIGAVVRNGQIEGSKAAYTPADILVLMDRVGTQVTGVDGQKYDGIKAITSRNSLNKAVSDLAMDERVGKHFGHLEARLGIEYTADEQEQYTFTSSAQLEGYLMSGSDRNVMQNPVPGVHTGGENWIPVIMEQVHLMQKHPDRTWLTEREATDLIGSSAPLIHNTGLEVKSAYRTAEAVGVDVALIARSAEKIQERMKLGHDLAEVALSGSMQNQVDQYKDNLSRRSHNY